MVIIVFLILACIFYIVHYTPSLEEDIIEINSNLYNNPNIDLKYYISSFYNDLQAAIKFEDNEFISEYIHANLIKDLSYNGLSNLNITSELVNEYRDTFTIKYYGVAKSNENDITINENYTFRYYLDDSLKLINIQPC